MKRFEVGLKIIKKTGEYLKKEIDKVRKIKELKYDVKLLQDLKSEKFIIENIKNFYPDDSFLCEEEGLLGKDKENLWIIDPLDGSLNFSRGIPHYCISIAFIGKNENFGIVYDFLRKEIFTGIKGKGAFLNGKKICVSNLNKIEEAILSVGFMRSIKDINYGIKFLSDTIRKVRRIRIMGSACLDICYVACGRIDFAVYLELKRWDYEGAKIILEEAGGNFEEKKVNGIKVFIASNGKLKLEF
ncbi:MAG: inositol monophosphatase [Candidatus Omnitrophica bacterium]|nr:inositol monophosphatase [Candidatus Omnitrophota bacterium]